MRIVPLEEIPEGSLPQLAALKWLDGDAPQDIGFIRRLLRRGFPASPYYGLYALEDGEVLSKVETLDLPFAFPGVRRTVVGVSDVATRPDALGRGLARRVLAEIHRRERGRGTGWSFLWTRRSWSAHRLYEQLGYRDVHFPSSALRRIRRAEAEPGALRCYRLVRAEVRDAPRLDRLLADATGDRLGLVPRFRGSFRLKHDLGWRPMTKHRLLFEGQRLVGYAYVSDEPEAVLAVEVVVREARHAPAMLAALARLAKGKWLTLGHTTFVTDHRALLEGEGFAVYTTNHAVLMAKRLGGTDPADLADRACRDPRFSCHRGDVF